MAVAQVNHHIDDLEDLLAVESNNFEFNEINPQLVEILPAPEGFGGERLVAAAPRVAAPPQVAAPLPILPRRKAPPPQRNSVPVSVPAQSDSQINTDGSYSFR